MSAFAGPKIIEDELALALDAGNTKSYPGSGATWNDLSGNENDSLLRFTKFNLSRNNFTIEGWVNVISNSFFKNIITKWNFDTNREFIVRVGSNLNRIELSLQKESTETMVTFSGNTQIASNNWYHFAIVRNGNDIDIYLNGTKDNGADTFDDSVLISDAPINIGTINQGTIFAPIYISNLRVINGVALYTSNFTPSTTPLQNTPETVLLTCQNSLADSSSYNWNIQNGGSPIVSGLEPNTGFGSIFFDGTDDYSFITKSEPVWNASGWWEFNGVDNAIDIGNINPTSGATFNAWIYINGANTNYGGIFNRWGPGGNSLWIGTLQNQSSTIQVYFNGVLVHNITSLSLNTWMLLTVTHTGTNATSYINGIQTNTNSASLVSSTGTTSIGYDINRANYPFKGSIAQVSIYNRALAASEIQQNFNALRGRFGL